jgi:hypothetical protein
MKKSFRLEVAFAAIAVPLALVAPRGPVTSRLPAGVSVDSNWTGYGDVGGSYHDVGAVWQVPGIPQTKFNAYAYFWVGLGGDGNSSWLSQWLGGSGLEQIGVLEISGTGGGYFPFWEVIPRADANAKLSSSLPHIFMGSNGQPLSVRPGDFITASVTLTGGTYYMKISDNRGTNNTIWSRTVPAVGSGLSNDSAEVIMEDPVDREQQQLPLAKFGRVFFDGAFIGGNPIGSTNPVEFVLNPDNQGVGVSGIGANGDNFTVDTPLPAQSGPCTPKINAVGAFGATATQTVEITGSCFGTGNTSSAADTAYFRISDLTAGWNACWTGDPGTDAVTCNVSSWTNNEITFSGYTGDYGDGSWVVNSGDLIEIQVWNPQSGKGPTTYEVTAG